MEPTCEKCKPAVTDTNYPFDLGSYERVDVKTRDPASAAWFQRGLKWMFGFHHEEAIRCFERALELEPDFAMAWWGISHCHSPNYNVHQKNGYYQLSNTEIGFPSQKVAYDAIYKAYEFIHLTNDEGRALIEAQRIRCIWPTNDFAHLLLQPYCDALRLVHVSYPHDEDVACLFVEALIQLAPWQLFDPHSGQPAPHVDETQKVLTEALIKAPNHPGLCHLAIHLYEMAPQLRVALPHAEVLRRGLVPDAGHLLHMPAHIDVQIGQYAEAVATSERAVAANRKYIEFARTTGEEFRMYIGYIAHDFHMLIYAAMLGGMEQKALDYGRELMQFVQDSLERYPQRANDLDLYHAAFYHILVRFGLWQEIIEEPFLDDDDKFCASNATLHYARGLAFAAIGDVKKALEEQVAFEAARRIEKVYRRILHNNNATEMFAVGSEMLQGEILYRKGEYDQAFTHLRSAIALEDRLPYDEPPGQMQPLRHALGALLLEQDQLDEAEEVLRADLDRLPRNPWSLVGLRDCLARRSSPPTAGEIAAIEADLARAVAISDTNITHACACAGLRRISNV